MKVFLPSTSDLELLEMIDVDYIRRSVQRSIATALAGLTAAVAWCTLGDPPPISILFCLCVLAPCVTWYLPVKEVTRAAKIRRADMDLSLIHI